MRRFGWKQWVLLAAFVLVLMFTGIFAMRAVRRATYWRVHHDEPIRPWMSLPYIAHSYGVRPRVLYEALGIPHPVHDRRPIRAIAREQNRPIEDVISTIEKAIAENRTHPSGPAPPGEFGPPGPGQPPAERRSP